MEGTDEAPAMFLLDSDAKHQCPQSPSPPEAPSPSSFVLLHPALVSGPLPLPTTSRLSATHIITRACSDYPGMTAVAISRGVAFHDSRRRNTVFIGERKETVRDQLRESRYSDESTARYPTITEITRIRPAPCPTGACHPFVWWSRQRTCGRLPNTGKTSPPVIRERGGEVRQ